MAIPDYQTLMLPVLRLASHISEVRASDAVDRLASEFKLTETERSEPLPSGRGNQTLFSSRVHWAVTYLVHSELLVRPRRAHFQITSRGEEVLSRNLPRVDNKILAEFREFRDWIEKSGRRRERALTATKSTGASVAVIRDIESDETPLERIDADYQALINKVRNDLLDRVLNSSPTFFEGLIVDLLVAMGYGGTHEDAAQAVGRSGDEGIDGIIKEDPLGLDIVYLQAKRYQSGNIVGRPAVQAFAGSLDGFGASKGVLVSTSSFSRDAKEYAEKIIKRIILIDGDELTRLLVQHNIGVRTSAAYEIKRIDEDYFD